MSNPNNHFQSSSGVRPFLSLAAWVVSCQKCQNQSHGKVYSRSFFVFHCVDNSRRIAVTSKSRKAKIEVTLSRKIAHFGCLVQQTDTGTDEFGGWSVGCFPASGTQLKKN